MLIDLIQNLAAETAAYLTTTHPDYAILAARIAISNLHKETKKRFSEVVEDLYRYGACDATYIKSSSLITGNSQSKERQACGYDLESNL